MKKKLPALSNLWRTSGNHFALLLLLSVRLGPETAQAQTPGTVPAAATEAWIHLLQSATNLAPPVTWNDVTNPPAVVVGQFNITNTVSGAAQFFRLRKS